jgi:UDP-glucose 4-epimerase
MSKLNKSKSFILNCGYNKGYSVKEIVKIFSKIIKKNIKIRYCNKRRGDVKSIYCNNKKLKNIFPNWKREFSIKTSIENMIKWEKKLLN